MLCGRLVLEVFVRSPVRAPVQGCTPIFTLLNIQEPLAWNGGDAPSDLSGQVDLQFRCERLKRHPVKPESGKECHAAHLQIVLCLGLVYLVEKRGFQHF